MRMNRHNISLGLYGERIAVKYLKAHGYRILQTDFRSPIGQIDIVAMEKGEIVFVEVKTRGSADFGMPEEAIDSRKKRKILNVGLCYIKKKNISGRDLRIDVVSILVKDKADITVNLIKDAFGEE